VESGEMDEVEIRPADGTYLGKLELWMEE